MALLVALAALLPLGFVVWIAIQTGWETASALVFRPRVGELLVNTVLLEACTIPLAIVLAVTLAWLTERSDLPGAQHLGLARGGAAGGAGLRAQLCLGQRRPQPARPVRRRAGLGPRLLPVSLPAGRRRSCGGSIRRSRMSRPRSGLGPWRVFFRVVLPQLRLAICGGSLLIGLHLLAEYGLFVMIRFDTFTTAIVDQFQSAYNGPAANMLAGVLVVCCLALLWLEVAARGRERYARVGSGAARLAERQRLGWTCAAVPADPGPDHRAGARRTAGDARPLAGRRRGDVWRLTGSVRRSARPWPSPRPVRC